MVTVAEMIRRITAVNINDNVTKSIEDNTDEIKTLQVGQLKSGKRKDGKGIGKYKNKAYAQKKFSQNPLAGLGNVDLILTGAFKNDIFVDVREDIFVIDSADEKATELINRYGDPFGLSVDSNKELLPVLRKTFVTAVRTKLKL